MMVCLPHNLIKQYRESCRIRGRASGSVSVSMLLDDARAVWSQCSCFEELLMDSALPPVPGFSGLSIFFVAYNRRFLRDVSRFLMGYVTMNIPDHMPLLSCVSIRSKYARLKAQSISCVQVARRGHWQGRVERGGAGRGVTCGHLVRACALQWTSHADTVKPVVS